MLSAIKSSLALNGALAPIANRDYRRLLFGNALWWQTLFMEMIVMGWLVLEMTNSAWLVALIGFCRSAPFLLCGVVGGPITDRFGRRTVIVYAQATSLLAYAAIGMLIWSGTLELWHLGVCSSILGTAWSLDFPARRSLIPDLIGKAKTVDALLIESFAQGISRIIGPSLAGWLVASYGVLGCFVVLVGMAALALMAVYSLSRQPLVRVSSSASPAPLAAIGQGLRYVQHNQTILAVVLVTIAMNLLVFPYTTLLPIFARDVLGQGALGLGLLGTGTGIGAFVGLYLIVRLRRTKSIGLIFAAGTFFQCIGLAAFALSTSYPLSWGLLFCAGVGQSCFAIMQSSIVLLAASDEMRSRAMGSIVLAIGADPLGKLQTGLLAENFGAPFTLGLQSSVAAILIVLIAIWLPQLRNPMFE